MKQNKWIVISAFCTLFLVQKVFAFCNVTDDKGVTLHLAKPAERIVSLAPDITEILFAIHGEHQVVGVISGSDYPPAARNLASVGSYLGLDLEKIMMLHPDLIVTWDAMFVRQLSVLKKLGIPIYTTRPTQLEDIPKTMQHLGCLLGQKQSAHAVAEEYAQKLATLRTHYHAQKVVTLFYQMDAYSLITINKNSWINQVITLCGGRNVFANSRFPAPTVGIEAVLKENPDVIVSTATSNDWQRRWQAWPEISAIKHHALYTINPDLLDRAGPRLILGAEQMCRDLQTARLAAF